MITIKQMIDALQYFHSSVSLSMETAMRYVISNIRNTGNWYVVEINASIKFCLKCTRTDCNASLWLCVCKCLFFFVNQSCLRTRVAHKRDVFDSVWTVIEWPRATKWINNSNCMLIPCAMLPLGNLWFFAFEHWSSFGCVFHFMNDINATLSNSNCLLNFNHIWFSHVTNTCVWWVFVLFCSYLDVYHLGYQWCWFWLMTQRMKFYALHTNLDVTLSSGKRFSLMVFMGNLYHLC